MNNGRAALSWISAFEAAVVAGALLCAFVAFPPTIVERYYSVSTFPFLQRRITPVTNLLPVAVLDVLLVVVACAAIAVLARGARRAWSARSIARLFRTIAHLGALGAALYLAFLLVWGFNYRRVPMTTRLLLNGATPTSDDVLQLGLRAVDNLNTLYGAAHGEGNGIDWQDPRLRRAFAEVQRALSDAPPAEPGRPKQSLLGFYFRWAGVDGMINPFGLEVLVNPDLLPFERAFVTSHEWGHLAGYADESDANFVGWLTCMRASPAAQYSGWFYLYWQISSEIDSTGRARLGTALADGPRRDVNAVIERVRRTRIPALQRAGWQVYDQYLKANRVEAGVRSYGAVVNLILQTRFDAGGMPVRRASASNVPPWLDLGNPL